MFRVFFFLAVAQSVFSQVSPVRPVAAAVRESADTGHALETIRAVYATDRWFTFPKFEETAAYLRARLLQAGLEDVEIGGAKADGKTQSGFWTMPLAWDVRSATLEMLSPESVMLGRYSEAPSSLGMWSGATPPSGITAELVDPAISGWQAVRGKFVLTEKNSAGLKEQLVRSGAAGAVNGFSENPSLKNGRQWINAWGDDGWGFTKRSTPLPSFSVTAGQAAHLRELLRNGQKVTVRATADTRFYEGRYPWVTGVLRGASEAEEVLVLGHTSEQGAHDNASGVSASLEALRTLSRLIREGKLPKPQRSIRILLMPEMYGSLSYIAAHRERTERSVAALTVDTPAASYDLAGTEYTVYMNPHAAKSWTDALIQRVTEASVPKGRPWHVAEHTTGTDAYLGEPTVGVPDVWIYSGTGVESHHNSEDTPGTIDERSLRDLITITGTYLYFAAAAGERDVPWLADIVLERAYTDMHGAASRAVDGLSSGDRPAGSFGLQRVAYFADRSRDAVLGVLRLVPEEKRSEVRKRLEPVLGQIASFRDAQLARLRGAGAELVPLPLPPEAKAIVVRRKRPGTLPLDDLPRDQWQGYPSGAWDKQVTVALYWCDGKRNLEEVIQLTRMEMGRVTDFDFVGYFRFLRQHGYVDFAQ